MIVTTPAALAVTVPVKPPEAVAVTTEIAPLSLGAADGVTVVEPPGASEAMAYAPRVGAVLAVTLTVMLTLLTSPAPSLTFKVKLLAPLTAAQEAATVAVTLPLVLVKPLTVRPAGMFDAVTDRLAAGVKSSLRVARAETVPALPCCLVKGADGVMAGAALTVKAKLALEVAPQLSVAVTVMV